MNKDKSADLIVARRLLKGLEDWGGVRTKAAEALAANEAEKVQFWRELTYI